MCVCSPLYAPYIIYLSHGAAPKSSHLVATVSVRGENPTYNADLIHRGMTNVNNCGGGKGFQLIAELSLKPCVSQNYGKRDHVIFLCPAAKLPCP
jgi:hypothetical protein